MMELFDIYEKIKNDREIFDEYNKVCEYEENNEHAWAVHNYSHIENVLKKVRKILSDLNYDNEFIIKAEIATIFHDVGATLGKGGHALRSYEWTREYFKKNNISFPDMDLVLEAIKIHSDGFDTDNMIARVLILADKLDVSKTRITDEGSKVIGNRQYCHIEDVLVEILNGVMIVNFSSDGKLNKDEFLEYYFTNKIFKAVNSFCNVQGLNFKILIDGKELFF